MYWFGLRNPPTLPRSSISESNSSATAAAIKVSALLPPPTILRPRPPLSLVREFHIPSWRPTPAPLDVEITNHHNQQWTTHWLSIQLTNWPSDWRPMIDSVLLTDLLLTDWPTTRRLRDCYVWNERMYKEGGRTYGRRQVNFPISPRGGVSHLLPWIHPPPTSKY